MTRKRLRAALLTVVAAALAGIGYLVSRNVSDRRIDPLREVARELLPEVTQRIQDFRRVKMEKGRAVWEITAEEAQYLDDTRQVVVREPRVTFWLEDGERRVQVRGAEGRLVLDGQEVQSLTLRGKVAVRLDDLELETEEATYVRARDVIISPVPVVLRGPTLEVSGQGMEMEVGPQQVRLLGTVHTTLRADAARS
jgi:LPS export ABC transporter protein LptC